MAGTGDVAQRSLWLVPSEEDAAALLLVMAVLRDGLHGPAFAPHVTLRSVRGDVDVAAIAARIARRITVEVADVELGRTVHQSLYARVRPSAALDDARRVAADVAGAPVDGKWMPHVSLHYGLLDASARDVARSALAQASLPRAIRFDAVAAWSTDGAVDDWRCLSEVPLAP